MNETLRSVIRSVPDFPKPGIVFRDITPLLLDARARTATADALADAFRADKPDVVVGIESRGFVFGALVAERLDVGLALVRKKGKLPYRTVAARYALEYGFDEVEMHVDAVRRGQRVLVVDDLIATGGTAAAACELVEKVGGVVIGCGFVIELSFLDGRKALAGRRIRALVDYESE